MTKFTWFLTTKVVSSAVRSPQSAVRSPQSAVRSPQSAVRLVACLLFAVFLLSSSALFAQATINKTGWNLIFHEDFKSSTYYPTAMQQLANNFDWRTVNGDFQEGIRMRDTNIIRTTHIDNSGPNYDATLKCHRNAAVYNVTYNGGTLTDACYWNAGWLRTTFEDYTNSGATVPSDPHERGGYLYGMFEVRCKVPRHWGATPAIWLTGNNAWPPEVDFFENASPYESTPEKMFTQFFSTTHWSDPALPAPNHSACGNHFRLPTTLGTDFHTWTVVWTPYALTWFLDGVELKSATAPIQIPAYYQNADGTALNLGAALTWRSMDLICSNGTNGSTAYKAQDIWDMYAADGIERLEDLVIDYIKVYRPAALTTPLTIPEPNKDLYHRAAPFDISTVPNQVAYRDNVLFPAYLNTPYRSAQGWQSYNIGKSVLEVNVPAQTYIADATDDYTIIGKPAILQGEERFVFVDDYYGKKLRFCYSDPTVNNPNRHSFKYIDNTPITAGQYELAAHKPSAALYNVYYRRNAALWNAKSTDNGLTWATAAVANATNVGVGSIVCGMEGTTETVLYRSTTNKLIRLTRANATGAFTATDITTLAKIDATTTAAPSDVASNIISDPVQPNTYYYLNTTNKIVKIFLSGTAWKYKATTLTMNGYSGIAKIQATIKGDNTSRKILVQASTQGGLYAFNPDTYVFTAVRYISGYNYQNQPYYTTPTVTDFVVGNSHNSNTVGSNPKNIYYQSIYDNKMYYLEYDITKSEYLSKPFEALGTVATSLTGLNNMLVNNKDILTFQQPIDGRMRKVKYSNTPAILLPCNACVPPTWNPTGCDAVPFLPKIKK